MANKIKFDRDNVVEKACDLFWKKGFHATSTRDIQQAIDMRPGSIYAAFGNKEGLFGEALHCYSKAMLNILNQSLERNDSILSGLEDFVRTITLEDRDQKPSNICMLVRSNAELTSDASSLLALTRALLEDFEKHISGLFKQAQASGELPTTLQPVDYARHFQIQFIGLRNYLNRSYDPKLADRLIHQAFRSIKQL